MADAPRDHAGRFDEQVRTVLADAAGRCPGFAARLDQAGLRAEDLTGVAALDRLPILTKDELLEQQQADPPFAGFVADDAPVRRIFQSPGPLYEAELDVSDPWRWASALRAAGFGADDVVLNAFGYHLSPAGAMFEEGARALGARVVPGGVGNLELQAQACVDLGVSAYIGLPSYLKALLERLDERDDAGRARITKAFVTAEPLPPSLRALLEERVPTVRQGYGTAEGGNLGYECETREGLHVPDDALVQVCDLSSGEARYDDVVGQVVVTLFEAASPVVRLGTGDLSAWLQEPCSCGASTPRLRGWAGRVGDAVKVRGMFLHPRQVDDVLAGFDGVARYRVVIDRVEHRDELRCEVVAGGGLDPERLAAHFRDALRFNVEVAVVDALPDDAPSLVDQRSWE
jgi:phenylacetate-CoA ligase